MINRTIVSNIDFIITEIQKFSVLKDLFKTLNITTYSYNIQSIQPLPLLGKQVSSTWEERTPETEPLVL